MEILVAAPELHIPLKKFLLLYNSRKDSACGVGSLSLAATDEVKCEHKRYESEGFHFLEND